MAGSYPNAPSRRMAWDDDGTIFLWLSTTTAMIERGESVREIVNNELNNAVSVSVDQQVGTIITIFPELREFDGFFFAKIGSPATYGALDTSTDTTNGIDGTWVERDSNIPDPQTILPDLWRSSITSFAVSNVRAVRVHKTGVNNGDDNSLRAWHMYGEISAGQTPDRLLWVDEITGLEFSLPIDYGDIPRGSARDRELRLKNNSGTLTANTLQITAEDFQLGSAAWYTFDVAGGGFVAVNSDIASLGSGATSALIRVRQIVPDAETLGLHNARAYVNVASWS